jgi:probable rRNA maturation factor
LWEGAGCPPLCLLAKVILLEHDINGVRERALALFAGRARRTLGLPKDVCIFITTNGQVRELNRRHCGKDEPTDVLSFPPGIPSWSGGDIAISAPIAAAHAAELGHSVETELKILILHGVLHLAGYDHERDGGEMEARELDLRKQFKLPLGLIERTHALAQPLASEWPAVPRRRKRKVRR